MMENGQQTTVLNLIHLIVELKQVRYSVQSISCYLSVGGKRGKRGANERRWLLVWREPYKSRLLSFGWIKSLIKDKEYIIIINW